MKIKIFKWLITIEKIKIEPQSLNLGKYRIIEAPENEGVYVQMLTAKGWVDQQNFLYEEDGLRYIKLKRSTHVIYDEK